MTTATALANPNLAFIKYWGNRDNTLRLPSNGSISMNLDGLYTRTAVSFRPSLPHDELTINGHEATDKQIAGALMISLNTVKTHVRNILAKLQVSTRREAARVAKNKGLV